MLKRNSFFWFVILFPVCALLGCGNPSNKLPGGVPAKGIVKYKGAPLPGASLCFIPDNGSGKHGMAIANEKGEFSMWTQEKDDGVLPGNYKVEIGKTSGGEPTIPLEEVRRLQEEEPDKTIPTTPIKREIPDRYFEAETSGLTITIPPGGKTDIVFELTE